MPDMEADLRDERPQATPAESGDMEEAGEPTSVFLSKEALGGRTVKEGETLSMTVKSVDPETGEVEACVSDGGDKQTDERPAYEKRMDEMMPED